MPFPSPPWKMNAQMWLSMFLLRSAAGPDRPAGLYGAAFVDYGAGSPLTYHELLVARLLLEGTDRHVRITDIWVDSEESRAGGRSLWAFPKEMADLPAEVHDTGAVERTTVSGHADGRRIASGTFNALPAAALVRTPFRASTSQVRDDGSTVVAPMHGSARSLPCHASWDFATDGPLGFLRGRRPFLSFRMADLRLTFG
jgi:acetoacetate decarboxylase